MLAKPRDDGRDGCYVDADVAKVHFFTKVSKF